MTMHSVSAHALTQQHTHTHTRTHARTHTHTHTCVRAQREQYSSEMAHTVGQQIDTELTSPCWARAEHTHTHTHTYTPFMNLYDPMYNGYVPVFDFENEYLPSLYWVVTVVSEKQQVSTIERWLHTSTKRKHCVHKTIMHT